MKRNLIAVLFFLVSLLLTASCSKFSNGEPVTEQRSIGQRFNTLCMFNNVNVNLMHSNNPHMELTCPKNLIGLEKPPYTDSSELNAMAYSPAGAWNRKSSKEAVGLKLNAKILFPRLKIKTFLSSSTYNWRSSPERTRSCFT